MAIKSYIAVMYSKGPSWVEGKPVYEQNLMEHGQFMADLQSKGNLVISGPFMDDSGGLLIVKGKTLEEVEQLIKTDPGVTNGVFSATIRPWHIAFES